MSPLRASCAAFALLVGCAAGALPSDAGPDGCVPRETAAFRDGPLPGVHIGIVLGFPDTGMNSRLPPMSLGLEGRLRLGALSLASHPPGRTVPATRYLAEIDLLGRPTIAYSHEGPGGSDALFGRWGGSTLAVDRVITDDVRELYWQDADGTELLRVNLGVAVGCTGADVSGLLVREDDSGLWLLSGCEAPPLHRRAHLFLRDGTRPLGPEGVALGLMYTTPSSESPVTAVSPDGGFWYVTEEGEGLDAEVRAVRIGPDGAVLARSPVLTTARVAGREYPELPVLAQGMRGEVGEDGSYYVHFVARVVPRPDTTPPASHFFRVSPDGSLVWSWVAPPGLVATSAAPWFASDRVAVHAGGMVGVLTSWSDGRPPMRLVQILEDGTRPLGDAGVELEWFEEGQQHFWDDPIHTGSVDVDSAGNVFVVVAQATAAYAQRYDLEGRPAWSQPVLFTGGRSDWYRRVQLLADERGGAWAFDFAAGPLSLGRVNHVDASGLTLFWGRAYQCGEFFDQPDEHPYRVRTSRDEEPFWPGTL